MATRYLGNRGYITEHPESKSVDAIDRHDGATSSKSGRVIAVDDLASAHAAIDEIEEQGEGLKHAEVWDGDRDMFHREREEVAHYFRFMELAQGPPIVGRSSKVA